MQGSARLQGSPRVLNGLGRPSHAASSSRSTPPRLTAAELSAGERQKAEATEAEATEAEATEAEATEELTPPAAPSKPVVRRGGERSRRALFVDAPAVVDAAHGAVVRLQAAERRRSAAVRIRRIRQADCVPPAGVGGGARPEPQQRAQAVGDLPRSKLLQLLLLAASPWRSPSPPPAARAAAPPQHRPPRCAPPGCAPPPPPSGGAPRPAAVPPHRALPSSPSSAERDSSTGRAGNSSWSAPVIRHQQEWLDKLVREAERGAASPSTEYRIQ